MATLFDITHDVDLEEYNTLTVGVGCSLQISASASISGTPAGMIVISDNQEDTYGQKEFAFSSNDFRFRIHIKPISITGTGSIRACMMGLSASPWRLSETYIERDGSAYYVWNRTKNDAGTDLDTSQELITLNKWVCVEVYIERATTNVSSDGRLQMWIDGSLIDTISNIDNYDMFALLDKTRIGATGVSAATTGELYIDEIEANDDGTQIGCLPDIDTTTTTISTTTLQPLTPKSFYQSQSLSLLAFTPTIGSYTVRGIYNGEIGKQVNAYSHTKNAVGGYLSASFTIFDGLTNLEDWLFGLGRHIEVYNPSLVRIWEGFVNRVTINIGGLSVVRGPLTNIANRVWCVYSTVDTSVDPPIIGVREKTEMAEDTTSQGKYGIIEKVVSVGGTTPDEAEQIRDTWLQENKEPLTSQQFNNQSTSQPSATVECLGYVHWLNLYMYNQFASIGTVDVSTQIENVLSADPNGLFSTDYTGIDTNTLQVNRYTNDDMKGWDYIKSLTSRGDASDNRYTFGIYNDRKAIYTMQPSEKKYLQRLTDPKVRVETQSGLEVKPWNVEPSVWNFYPDFLIGKSQPSDFRQDPRYEFIENMSYNAPWGLSHSGSKTSRLSQKLAKLGLGGTG